MNAAIAIRSTMAAARKTINAYLMLNTTGRMNALAELNGMPTNSRVDIGFAFSAPTGRKVRSHRKKLHALIRAIETDGEANDIDGVHITARWRNPEDKAARSQAWKDTDNDGDLEEFFGTMSGLTSMLIDVNKLRLDYEKTFTRAGKVQRKKATKKSGRSARTVRKVAKRKRAK